MFNVIYIFRKWEKNGDKMSEGVADTPNLNASETSATNQFDIPKLVDDFLSGNYLFILFIYIVCHI